MKEILDLAQAAGFWAAIAALYQHFPAATKSVLAGGEFIFSFLEIWIERNIAVRFRRVLGIGLFEGFIVLVLAGLFNRAYVSADILENIQFMRVDATIWRAITLGTVLLFGIGWPAYGLIRLAQVTPISIPALLRSVEYDISVVNHGAVVAAHAAAVAAAQLAGDPIPPVPPLPPVPTKPDDYIEPDERREGVGNLTMGVMIAPVLGPLVAMAVQVIWVGCMSALLHMPYIPTAVILLVLMLLLLIHWSIVQKVVVDLVLEVAAAIANFGTTIVTQGVLRPILTNGALGLTEENFNERFGKMAIPYQRVATFLRDILTTVHNVVLVLGGTLIAWNNPVIALFTGLLAFMGMIAERLLVRAGVDISVQRKRAAWIVGTFLIIGVVFQIWAEIVISSSHRARPTPLSYIAGALGYVGDILTNPLLLIPFMILIGFVLWKFWEKMHRWMKITLISAQVVGIITLFGYGTNHPVTVDPLEDAGTPVATPRLTLPRMRSTASPRPSAPVARPVPSRRPRTPRPAQASGRISLPLCAHLVGDPAFINMAHAQGHCRAN